MANYPYRELGIMLDLDNWQALNDNFEDVAVDLQTQKTDYDTKLTNQQNDYNTKLNNQKNEYNGKFGEVNARIDNIAGEIEGNVYAEIVNGARLIWQEPVDTFADLATVYPAPEEGWASMARDTGTVYRFDGTAWVEIQEIDATAINEVDSRLTSQLADKVSQAEALTLLGGISEGTPLFAPNTAGMTDTARNYVNTTDGLLYTHNGTAWVSTGVTYQATGIADGTVTYKKMSSDLTATFEELSKIGSDLITTPENVTANLATFFDVYTSVSVNDGVVSGVKKVSPTAVVGGGLFDAAVKEIQFKGMTGTKYVVLAYDGTIVYHFNINNGTSLVLRKHDAAQTYGSIATYTLPVTVTADSLLKVVLATSTIDIYVDEVLRFQIPNNATTAAYFTNRRLGFLQIPNGDITVNSVSYGQLRTKISTIEDDINDLKQVVKPTNRIDLVMFMGQSNMAGRGDDLSLAPTVPTGHAYEFRAISDPTKLYNVVEPFGVNENKAGGITEVGMKTGSMVSAFVNEYYKVTNVPIVGVSASKGGSSINQWQPGMAYLNDAITRFNDAESWLISNGYVIRHKYMVWCQGETDGDAGMTFAEYNTKFQAMVEAMQTEGVEKCFVVRIGNRTGAISYADMILTQTNIAKEYEDAVLVSTKFAGMVDEGLMKADGLHYKQAGYNIVGEEAGVNTAFYINNLKEPTMYDVEYDNLYFSKKL